jgi:hypothetical protein
MYTEGNIIYFDPFYFKNGNTAKSKYFVVLKNTANSIIIASLPTRKDNIPEANVVESGCVELADISMNCFVISPNLEITECGKRFDFKTHLYGYEIDSYDLKLMNELYQIEGSDYVVWGKMKNEIFQDLITCFKNSRSVKRKFKNYL